jgi:O-antigen/teichoic acid export membrane protein
MDLAPQWRELVSLVKRDPVGAALFSLVSDSMVYLTGGILIGLGNVILIPLYTRHLSLSEFGVYALVDVFVVLITTLAMLKLDVSYLKWFADLDASQQGKLLGTTLFTGLAFSSVGGLGLALLLASRVGWEWLHVSTSSFAWLILPVVVLETLQGLLLTNLRARRMAARYSGAAIARLAVLVVASVYLLASRHLQIEGVFLGRLIGDAAGIAVLAWSCIGNIRMKFSAKLLKPMIWFGLPLIWSVLTVMLQDAAGRYFLNRYSSLDQVGLLGSAIKIGAAFQVLITAPFGVAWGGLLFQIVKQKEAKAIYSKIFSYVFVLASGTALLLTIFAPTLFRIFTSPAYYSAISVLPLILLVRAANVIEQPAATGIYLAGRTDLFAYIYSAALCVNVLLLFLLVPRYGIMGAGWAWLIGSAVNPILMFALGQRFYRLSVSKILLFLSVLPWAFVLLRFSGGNWRTMFDSVLFQVVAGAGVVLGMLALLVTDFRRTRKRRLREARFQELSLSQQQIDRAFMSSKGD